MNAQPTLFAEQQRIRLTKKQLVYDFFAANVGQRFGTDELHDKFGTALRSRASDINRDPNSHIVIRNHHTVKNGQEVSWYWAERREP